MFLDITFLTILKVIASFCKGERDTIEYKPKEALFQSKFWIEKRANRNWFQKWISAPFLDGWHLMEWMQITAYDFMVAYLIYRLYENIWALLYVPLLLLGAHWIWFHISYEN